MNTPKLRRPCFAALFCLVSVVVLSSATEAIGNDASASDGFTEPNRTIHVAAPESGIIGRMFVEEGTQVREGDPLVQLDIDVQAAMLAIAKVAKDAHGRVNASEAEVDLRRHTLEALESLQLSGHARELELERARADLAIAEGQLTAAREQQRLKELEYESIRVQIDRRTIRAPIDGVVTTVLKHEGEFSAPNDPHLLVLVQLDPLYAMFDVNSVNASQVSEGDSATVYFPVDGHHVESTVEFVSPVINAESGTVAIKVRIPNPQARLKSGQACSLNLQK